MKGTSALLLALGAVAVAFGLLSAVLAIFQPVTDITWILGNLIVGLALLGAGVGMGFETLRERMRSGEGRRAGRFGTSAVAGTLAGLAILSMLGFLSTRYTHRWDWSEAHIHTLTQQTTDLLDRLDHDVHIQAFFTKVEAPEIHELLDRYVYASDKVKVDYIDPNSAPGLVQDLQLDPEALARGLVHISVDGGGSVNVSEFTESSITNAILKLTSEGGKKVYFTKGHGEREIFDPQKKMATGKESFGRAAEALRNETYEVDDLLLASTGDVPDDADVVVVAGPTRPFLEPELDALKRYVDGGGALFVSVDPRAKTNIYPLLKSWGIELGDDFVIDRSLALFGQATSPFAAVYDPHHPITAPMKETALFPMVRSVELDDAASKDFTVLVKTGKDSWAERDLEGSQRTGRVSYGDGDLMGPVPIAVAGEPHISSDDEAKRGRLVVFGDSDFASNEFIDSFRDRDLFVNSVNWLVGDVEHIAVRPNVSRASRFKMDKSQFRRITNLSLFVIPETIALIGVVGWWIRRGRASS